MKSRLWLLSAPLGALVLLVGMFSLAAFVPGYSHVHQTVSEIGEVGSPVQLAFTLMLCAVAACVLIFGLAVRAVALQAGRSTWAAYLIILMAIPAAGVGIFSAPHPLHNVFGLSETVGYIAPLVLALTWWRAPGMQAAVLVSWLAFVSIFIAIGLNMSPMYPHSALWAEVKPVIGLAQRLLFASWFAWATTLGILLFRQTEK